MYMQGEDNRLMLPSLTYPIPKTRVKMQNMDHSRMLMSPKDGLHCTTAAL
jgi:hypothetical protein